jgi:tetratricopeptide (TPR) repeat protein/mono/diheme cytochrome c family protein
MLAQNVMGQAAQPVCTGASAKPPYRIGLRLCAAPALILLAGPAVFAAAPNFAHDIAPIVYTHCIGCHHAGGSGRFPLLHYEDVRKRAELVMRTTESRYMPPWLPEPGHGSFSNEQRLTNEQIQIIADWVAQGMPEGPASETPSPPEFTDAWQLGKPDLVLEAPAPFNVPASGPDVYWNFVFRPQVTARHYVRAIEIRPGSRQLVHHANLLIDRMGVAHTHELASGQGFPGMDLALFRSPFDPDGHFLFWKPGGPPRVEAPGFAWRLDPGAELVLNTHFHPIGRTEAVRPSLGLYFTDQPQTRFPLILELENDEALHIPPGARDFTVSDSFTLPMDVDVLAIYPHAHYLGHVLEAWATLPNGSRIWLIRIPNWDPAWQSIFECAAPVFLPQGSRVEMRYHYDNSAANIRNPNQPPKMVEAGNQSTDEMGHLWLRVLPHGTADRRRELEEALLRHRLAKKPRDFTANLNLGAVLLSRLNAPAAVTALQTAVAADPTSFEARNMLGLALARVGRTGEAIAEFQVALKLKPGSASARFNLANGQIKAGDLDAAIDNLHQALALLPGDPQPTERLEEALAIRAGQLASQEKWAEAETRYRELVERVPRSAGLRNDFAEVLRREGHTTEAAEQYRQALTLDPNNQIARQGLEALHGR